MHLYDFETSEFEKINLFMRGIKSEETDKEKMVRYFNLWSFESTQTENSYSDATVLTWNEENCEDDERQ